MVLQIFFQEKNDWRKLEVSLFEKVAGQKTRVLNFLSHFFAMLRKKKTKKTIGGSGRATLGITLSTASCTHQVIFLELPDDDWSRWTVRALTARSVVRHEERERDDSSPLLAPEYSYAISLDFCSDPIPEATWDFQIIPPQVALIFYLQKFEGKVLF